MRLETDLLAKYPRGCRLDEEKSDALAMAIGLATPSVGRVTDLRWQEAEPGKLTLSLTLQQLDAGRQPTGCRLQSGKVRRLRTPLAVA